MIEIKWILKLKFLLVGMLLGSLIVLFDIFKVKSETFYSNFFSFLFFSSFGFILAIIGLYVDIKISGVKILDNNSYKIILFIVGTFIFPISILFKKIGLTYFASIPNQVAKIFLGNNTGLEHVMIITFIMLFIYPIIFGIFGLIIDSVINKLKSKKN